MRISIQVARRLFSMYKSVSRRSINLIIFRFQRIDFYVRLATSLREDMPPGITHTSGLR